MAVTRRGTLMPRSTEVAATASGGEMMPPSKNPSASVNPGITARATYATMSDVNATSPNASSPMGRRQRQKSFHEVVQAAFVEQRRQENQENKVRRDGHARQARREAQPQPAQHQKMG